MIALSASNLHAVVWRKERSPDLRLNFHFETRVPKPFSPAP